MELPPQPNFRQLGQYLASAGREVSLIPNVPAIDEGRTTTNQLQQILTKLAEQSEQIAGVKSSVTTLRDEVSTLRGEVRTLQGNMTTLQGNMTTLQGEVTALRGEVRTIGTRMDARSDLSCYVFENLFILPFFVYQ